VGPFWREDQGYLPQEPVGDGFPFRVQASLTLASQEASSRTT